MFKPTILDIDKKHNLQSEHSTITLDNAERYWSICNIQRSQYYDTNKNIEVALNKATCNFIKLSLLSKAMRRKIQLDMTSTSHCVTLGPFKVITVCMKCSEKHSEKSCKETKCYRCQSTAHLAIDCKNPLICMNCGGPHLCTSDLCIELLNRSIEKNRFVVNFELGECIIRHPIQLFKTRLTIDEYESYARKEDIEQSNIDLIKEQVLAEIGPSLHNHSNEITELKNIVQTHTVKFGEMETVIKEQNIKLDKVSADQTSTLNLIDRLDKKFGKYFSQTKYIQ